MAQALDDVRLAMQGAPPPWCASFDWILNLAAESLRPNQPLKEE